MREREYSVSWLNNYIGMMFQQDFLLSHIKVTGEVSNCKYHTSGHIYFTLKDEKSQISAVMFAGNRKGLAFRMQEGQNVCVEGSIKVYERDGKYQLYASRIELAGIGNLYEQFEKKKRELEEMGMFSPEYKQPIPKYAKRIGIVTAPTGAAIRDIMNISYRRNPYIQLILCPSLVQGDQAALNIARAIECLDNEQVDVIIVGRGGGSMEDLWAFNEEIVARAIFSCMTPVISAVGHETDFTIADFVADLRAPTPSAAAELAVADFRQTLELMMGYQKRLRELMQEKIEYQRTKTESYRMRLQFLSPVEKIRRQRENLLRMEERLQSDFEGILLKKRQKYQIYIEKMKGLSPLLKLNQGYAFVEDQQKKAVYSVMQVKPEDVVTIYVSDGKIQAEVKNTVDLGMKGVGHGEKRTGE